MEFLKNCLTKTDVWTKIVIMVIGEWGSNFYLIHSLPIKVKARPAQYKLPNPLINGTVEQCSGKLLKVRFCPGRSKLSSGLFLYTLSFFRKLRNLSMYDTFVLDCFGGIHMG